MVVVTAVILSCGLRQALPGSGAAERSWRLPPRPREEGAAAVFVGELPGRRGLAEQVSGRTVPGRPRRTAASGTKASAPVAAGPPLSGSATWAGTLAGSGAWTGSAREETPGSRSAGS